MTVASTITSVQGLGNGVTTTYAFNNKVFAATDLVVTLIDTFGNLYLFIGFLNAATGLSYVVNGVDVDTGCSVQFSAPVTNGWTVDIRSATPETQSTSVKNQGTFYPELHEEAFDRLTRLVQDLYRLAYLYSVHGPDIESVPWPSVGSAIQRANQLLGFNNLGVLSLFQTTFSGVVTGTMLNNLAALRLLTPKTGGVTSVIVMGAATAGDGGGGIYFYNSADNASADNGGTIIVSADASRWYLAWRGQ